MLSARSFTIHSPPPETAHRIWLGLISFPLNVSLLPRHDLLVEELLALERNNSGKFRAGQGKHDDTVFALLWAVFEAVKFSPSKADITII
jgi:hypothetical protein